GGVCGGGVCACSLQVSEKLLKLIKILFIKISAAILRLRKQNRVQKILNIAPLRKVRAIKMATKITRQSSNQGHKLRNKNSDGPLELHYCNEDVKCNGK